MGWIETGVNSGRVRFSSLSARGEQVRYSLDTFNTSPTPLQHIRAPRLSCLAITVFATVFSAHQRFDRDFTTASPHSRLSSRAGTRSDCYTRLRLASRQLQSFLPTSAPENAHTQHFNSYSHQLLLLTHILSLPPQACLSVSAATTTTSRAPSGGLAAQTQAAASAPPMLRLRAHCSAATQLRREASVGLGRTQATFLRSVVTRQASARQTRRALVAGCSGATQQRQEVSAAVVGSGVPPTREVDSGAARVV